MNTRRAPNGESSRSLKPYVAVVTLLVVAAVVAFSLAERWTRSDVDEDHPEALEGGGRVVIGSGLETSPSEPPKSASNAPAHRREDFTFYKSLGNAPPARLKPQPKSVPAVPPESSRASDVQPQATPSTRKTYTVQVGSFRDRASAERMALRLKRRHHQRVSVTRVVLPHVGVRYRVRVGELRTRADALKLAQRLKSTEKVEPFVATVVGS